MSVTLFNSKTGHIDTCDAEVWADCVRHDPKNSWVVFTPEMEHSEAHKEYLTLVDEQIESAIHTGRITVRDYN